MVSLEAISKRRRHEGHRRENREKYLLCLSSLLLESGWVFSYTEWFMSHSARVNRYLQKTAEVCKEQQREFERVTAEASVATLVALGRKIVMELYLLKPFVEQTLMSLPDPSGAGDRENIHTIRKEFKELLLELDLLPDELMVVLKRLEKKELENEEINTISDRYNLLLNDFLDSIPERFKVTADGIYKPIWAVISQIWMVRKLMMTAKLSYVPTLV